MHQELARLTLQLLPQARVSVDDQQLLMARQVRAWLNGIAIGALVVSEAPAPEAEKPSEENRAT